MKKGVKTSSKQKVIIAVATILAILILVAGGIAIYSYIDKTPELYTPIEKVDFLGDWQKTIKDDTKLNQIVMPGSHDAGCNNMMPLARTQGHDIYDQLIGGARYFDLRVTKKGDDLVIFHSIIKGMKFQKVLDDFNRFFEENPTEFVVMDFQKLGKGVNGEVIEFIAKNLDMSRAMVKSEYPKIEETTIGELRENNINFIIIWNNNEDAQNYDFLYSRGENLHSFYDRKFHMNGDGNVLVEHFDEYYNRYDGTGFFVLQSQRTATVLTDKPSEMELKWGDTFTKFAENLNNDTEKLQKTNIIMRDFIVSDTKKVKTILSLNLTKGLVKDEFLEEFKENISQKY